MPDRDNIHPSLPNRYQKVGRQLYEGSCSGEVLAYAVMRQVKEDVQAYGDAPLQLIKQSADVMRALPGGMLTSDEDWDEASTAIDDAAQRLPSGDARAWSWAKAACKEYLVQLRYGYGVAQPCSDPEAAILKRYVKRVYGGRFAAYTSTLPNDVAVTQQTVEERVEAIEPDVDRVCTIFATQMQRHGTTVGLRMPRRCRATMLVSLDEDLGQIGHVGGRCRE